MIAAAADKNNSKLNMRLIRRFHRFMANLELRDMYLHGRRYTWSNEREAPTLVRIDWVLCTSTWESAHPSCLLRCHSSAASDHCPLMVDCAPRPLGAYRFHFEKFWPKMPGFAQVVSEAWCAVSPDPDPFRVMALPPRGLTTLGLWETVVRVDFYPSIYRIHPCPR